MTAKLTLLLLTIFGAACFAQEDTAPTNEFALGLGGIPALSRSDIPSLEPGPGVAFQVNYGRRFLNGSKVALYGEIKFVASPLRDVSSSVNRATQNFASIDLTPGIQVKFKPASRVSRYAVVGGGYADYAQSTTRIDGQPNSASREFARGAFDFDAGVDVRVCRFVALRGEARDFYTGSPGFNVAAISGGQPNITATGAFVLRWH